LAISEHDLLPGRFAPNFGSPLAEVDPEVHEAIRDEDGRQADGLEPPYRDCKKVFLSSRATR